MRWTEFDVAKALCIMLVVMGHYAVEEPAWWVTTHDIIYTFHMPLFMFASGFIYIATKKNEDYWWFIFKKIKRLMIPYLTTSVIVVSLKLLSQNGGLFVQNPVSPLSFLKILYLPEAGYFLWFIWALWWFFCLIPWFKDKRTRTMLFFFAIGLHLLCPYFDLPKVFCLNSAANMLIWFMLGVMCFDWGILFKNMKVYYVALSLVGFVLALLLNPSLDLLGNSTNCLLSNSCRVVVSLLSPSFGILFIMCLSKWITQRDVPRIILIVSGSSYIIYLFHTTFMGFVRAFLLKLSLFQSLPLLTIFLVVASGVALPVLLHKMFLKTRTTRFLFGLK